MPSLLDWLTRRMPPRRPIVAKGVLIVAPPVCVAWPPTTRSTPLPSETAISPRAACGSKTNLSITIDEFGPISSVVLSMKTSCTLPEGDVSIFSSETTRAPISITRMLSPGGVPEERTFAAPAVPTGSALASVGSRSTNAATPVRSHVRNGIEGRSPTLPHAFGRRPFRQRWKRAFDMSRNIRSRSRYVFDQITIRNYRTPLSSHCGQRGVMSIFNLNVIQKFIGMIDLTGIRLFNKVNSIIA